VGMTVVAFISGKTKDLRLEVFGRNGLSA
jgi:hypothetical protein